MRPTTPMLLLAVALAAPATAGEPPVFRVLELDPGPDAPPPPDCTDRGELRDGSYRLTYGLTDPECCPARGLSTPVCVHDAEGKLLHRLLVHACWHAYDADALCSSMGLLPRDPGVFWLYEGDCPSVTDPDAPCRVHLQELGGPRRTKVVVLEGVHDPAEGCPAHDQLELDLSAATFEQPVITARRKGTP